MCGQRSKARLTKDEKTIFCKTDNFVLLVVPGLSTSSGSNSSSTSTSQDLSARSRAKWRTSPREWCRSSSKTQNKNLKRGDSRDADDCFRDLLEWLEECTDNLEDTEEHAPAHICQDSDSESPANVVSKSRKHSIYTHFPKDRNCDVCLRTQMTRAPCRRRTGEAPPQAEKLGDLTTADHKVLNKESESRDNHQYLVVAQRSCHSKDSILSVQKQTHLRRRKWESFSSRQKSRKSFIHTTRWNSEKLVKIFHGITELRHLVDPRRMVLLRAVRRVKEGTLAVLLLSGLDEKRWAESMECFCYLRSVQDRQTDEKKP